MRQICVICILLLSHLSYGQKSSEIGVLGGGGFYLGELNHNIFQKESTKPMFGILARHNPNPRISYKASIIIGKITGDDANSSDVLDIARNIHFESILYEGSLQIEFNYFTFELGNPKHPFTNYLFAGISAFKFKPVADLGGGEVELRDLETEFEKKRYSLIQPSIPFGGGIKLNFGEKITASAEWGLRLTFTDYLDDVSTIYPESLIQRGNANSNDWYSFFGVMIPTL